MHTGFTIDGLTIKKVSINETFSVTCKDEANAQQTSTS